MDRTSASNYTTNGGLRQYQDKNPAANLAGTSLVAADRNAVQEELVHGFIEAANVAPNAASWTQVGQAARRLAGGYVTNLSASATLTPDQVGLVLVNATAGNVVLTLPAAAAVPGVPLNFRFVRTDGSTNTVTFAVQGSDQCVSLVWGTMSSPGLALGFPADAVCDGVSRWVFTQRAHGAQVFTASGTFTWPSGVYELEAEVWGGGSGGAGGRGGAGNAGGYSWGRFAGTPGATVNVTIGAGGAGVTGASGLNSGAGGTTSFGSLLSATGGPAVPAAGVPTGGGIGIGGLLNLSGGAGQDISADVSEGVGAPAPRGGGGGACSAGGTQASYGAGGGASGLADFGGNGGAGLVLVRW